MSTEKKTEKVTKKTVGPEEGADAGAEPKLSEADQKNVTVIERVIESREIAPHDAFGKLNRQQVELIKRTYAKGATDDELKLFITVCHGLQLSPFSRQVHLVGRWDKNQGREVKQIQVGIDGFRATAERTGKYAGNDDAAYEGEKVIEVGDKQPTRKIAVPEKATVTVWKMVEGQRFGFTATARWDEYYPGPKMGFQWHSKPFLMLGKCAEALALRKGFPTLLSGIYTPEEMDNGRTESSEAERSAKAFNALKSAIAKASAKELDEFKAKMEKSDKYTPEQKEEFAQMVEARQVELAPAGGEK